MSYRCRPAARCPAAAWKNLDAPDAAIIGLGRGHERADLLAQFGGPVSASSGRVQQGCCARSRSGGLHLLSSLAWAETHAALARIERERVLTQVLVRAAPEALDTGPWRRVTISPEWKRMRTLASRWPLRGADLWHLAAAMSLRDDLPELQLLSYDARLAAAAEGEGLAL